MLTIKKQGGLPIIWVLTLLSLWVLTGCTPPGPRALLQGDRLIKEGSYAKAIVYLQEATGLLPQNAQAFNHLGLAYHGVGQPAEAADAYRKALTIDKNLAAARYNLGCLMLEQNNPGQAAAELSIYVMFNQKSAEAFTKLGVAHLRARQSALAERALRNALVLDRNQHEALNALGLYQLQINRSRDASAYFVEALRCKPDYGPALLNLAIISQQYVKNIPLAVQHYRRYLSLPGSQSHAGEVSATAAWLEKEYLTPKPLVTNTPAAMVVTNRPVQPVATNQAPQVKSMPALTNRSVPVAMPSSNQPAPPPVVRVVAPTNPVPVAVKPVVVPAPVATLVPAVPSVVVPAAKPEPAPVVKPIEDGMPVAAMVMTVVATNPAPEAASVTNLAPAVVPVVSAAATVAKPEKRGFFARLNPARLNPFKKDQPAASGANPTAEVVKAKVEPAPKTILTNSPQAGSGKVIVAALETVSPPVGPRYVAQVNGVPAGGNRAEAEVFHQQGLKAAQERQLPEAMRQYEAALKADPAYYDAAYNLGVAAFEGGELPRALRAFELALAVNPQAINAHYSFALVLMRAGYPVDSAQHWESYLEKNEGNVPARFTLANLYAVDLRDSVRACAHYRKVLALEPQHPQVVAIRDYLWKHQR
jgi:tetratricopeptide (TPR) repeat protein